MHREVLVEVRRAKADLERWMQAGNMVALESWTSVFCQLRAELVNINTAFLIPDLASKGKRSRIRCASTE